MDDQPTDKTSDVMPPVSRRAFVGLALGTVGTLLAACGREPPAPTESPAATEAATAPPTEPLPPPTNTLAATATETRLPSTATSLPPAQTSLTAAPTASPLPPTYTPVPATPTNPPSPTATSKPTDPPALSRASLMAHWPATGTSRVVVVRRDGAGAGDVPDPGTVLEMLDAGLSTLTDVPDALSVWRTLFDADERVLLKVNCISYGGPTQPAVTYAVAQRLQDSGLAAENILIFDRTDNELSSAGYTLNENGPGVRCHGSRGEATEAVLSQSTVRFFQEFDACDAVINIPIPKQHGMAGISVALKNHYGSVNRPGSLHGNSCDPAIAELNAQPNVRDKTRLVVGAALKVSPGDWNRPQREDALLLSFDPVALDTVARDILVRQREAQGQGAGSLIQGSRHLLTAQSLNLGATDVALIDLREVTLG